MRRLPPHLKKHLPKGSRAQAMRRMLSGLGLETICDEARCPNRVECHARGTASFLLMGDTCTRRCGFCSVKTGRPSPLDPDEPDRLAEAIRRMGLRHAVLTSVDRDDLPDGGAAHFAAAVHAVRRINPQTAIEVLTPDFGGDLGALDIVLAARPDVFNHNLETVPRLYPAVRRRSDFDRSLRVLHHAKRSLPSLWTKSGLMVGLGETIEEVLDTMRAARGAEVDLLTIGQYLQPTPAQVPVTEFIAPEIFGHLEREGLAMGFRAVFAGPFVRSSYLAEQVIPA
ncbi:lipoyl synthase [Candidatus Sumerlaeota bacterium]|nr:lipoyl synthase [Candidatus Sumerlaeota bacterium]